MADEWDLDDDIDSDELFGDDEDSLSSARKTFQVAAREGVDPPDESIIELSSDFELSYAYAYDDEEDGSVFLKGSITNRRDKPVRLGALVLVARDADGQLLDCVCDSIERTFSQAQELFCEFDLDGGVIQKIARIDLVVEYGYEFQRIVAAADLSAPDLESTSKLRIPLDLRVKTAPQKPGEPTFECELVADVWNHWDDWHVVVVARIDEKSPNLERDRDVLIALRDADGKVIAKEDSYGQAVPGGAVHREEIEIPTSKLSRLSRIDVGVKGSVERVELLRSLTVR